MLTRKPMTAILLVLLGMCTILKADLPDQSNKFCQEVLISMTDKDISQRKWPQEKKTNVETAMHWAIKEGVRQSPIVELSDKNLEKLKSDFADILITIVYPEEPESLQAMQIVSEVKTGLTNLSLGRFDRGLSEEQLELSTTNSKKYIDDVSLLLDDVFSEVEEIYVPKPLWKRYEAEQIELARIGIGLPTYTRDNSIIWKEWLPKAGSRDEYAMLINFLHTRIVSTLAVAAFGEEKFINNIFTIPVSSDNKETAIKVPDYPANSKQLVKAFVAEHQIGNAFVYVPQSLDFFPQWFRVAPTTESLVKNREEHRKKLQEMMHSNQYYPIKRKR